MVEKFKPTVEIVKKRPLDFIQIAREVIEIEATALLSADLTGIDKAVSLLEQVTGKVVVIGVGKSGIIGKKIAATLASTGTPAFFIHPTEALHGDLGMIQPNDGVIAISYSGESEELIKILPHLRRQQIPIVAVTGNITSTLAKFGSVVLSVKVSREACPLNIAPTASTTLTLAIGDALAVCLMKKKGFTKEQFAQFHPGGSLGKKLYTKVEDLMRKEFPTASLIDSLKEAILKMTKGMVGHLLFFDQGELVAILSDGDLRRAMMNPDFSLEQKAIKFATTSPKTIFADRLAVEALEIMEKYKIQLLPVIKGKKVVGIIHLHDLVSAGIRTA